MPETPDGYALLDSGDGGKLERFGPVVLHRPSPQALWTPRDPAAWSAADARFDRDRRGRGTWTPGPPRPEGWILRCAGQTMTIKPTGFGHVGLFPEQIPFWRFLAAASADGQKVLNLFAYTGGSSLAAARAGAAVTHLDASRGIVDWARGNAGLSGLDDLPVRWIVDDALKFAQREGRRGRRYHGIILDPPSFGRGSKGQVFKLERDLPRRRGVGREEGVDPAGPVALGVYGGDLQSLRHRQPELAPLSRARRGGAGRLVRTERARAAARRASNDSERGASEVDLRADDRRAGDRVHEAETDEGSSRLGFAAGRRRSRRSDRRFVRRRRALQGVLGRFQGLLPSVARDRRRSGFRRGPVRSGCACQELQQHQGDEREQGGGEGYAAHRQERPRLRAAGRCAARRTVPGVCESGGCTRFRAPPSSSRPRAA